MKHLHLYLILSFLCVSLSQGKDLVSLTSTDGRTISASIHSYDSSTNEVSIKVNGAGRLIPVNLERLDGASNELVSEWAQNYAIEKALALSAVRVPAETEREHAYDITLENTSLTDIKNLQISYSIPYKETKQVADGKTGSGKKAKTKYKEVDSKSVLTGDISIENLKARSDRKIRSTSAAVRSEQKLPNKKKPVINKHSLGGIYLKVYFKDKLVKEYESKHGVKQRIEKYDQAD